MRFSTVSRHPSASPSSVPSTALTTTALTTAVPTTGPFSQGARKCPGSRVANLEGHALLAQWVLDWKMELPAGLHFSDVPYDLQTVHTAQLPAIQFTPRQAA